MYYTKKRPVNLKQAVVSCLDYNSSKTLLCISATIYNTSRHDDDPDPDTLTIDYNLKRGYTPEQFDLFLHSLDYMLEDYRDHIGIIIWYTDDTWSWSYCNEEDHDISWGEYEKPNPDNFGV